MTTMEFSNRLVGLEGQLTRFALHLTANRDDAKDLLQDTFLRVLTYRNHFEETANDNLKALTFTIMKHTFINHYRKKVRQNVLLDTTGDLFLLSKNMDTFNVEPDSALREKEINKAIDQLDYKFKVPFKMHTQGYKYEEISSMLGLKSGTVKSRIFFTRKKLAKSLEGYS